MWINKVLVQQFLNVIMKTKLVKIGKSTEMQKQDKTR